MQSAPPYDGVGLVQSRVWVCTPVPQVTEHVSHALHSLKPPFTGKQDKFKLMLTFVYIHLHQPSVELQNGRIQTAVLTAKLIKRPCSKLSIGSFTGLT